MRRYLIAILLSGTACWAQVPSALESDPAGWKDILPPADFAGWTRLPFMTPNPMDAVSQWTVDTANRLLICEGNRGHEWLRYDRELTDAIFHVEFRFTKLEGDGHKYNSGVMLRNSADGTIYFQAQVGESGTGWLFGIESANGQAVKGADGALQRFNLRAQLKADRVKPAGEWNVYEVRSEGPKMTVWVNGAIVSEKDDIGMLKGYAGLEAEGYRIEFRNVLLKELKQDGAAASGRD